MEEQRLLTNQEKNAPLHQTGAVFFIIFLVVFPSEKGENVQMQGKAMKRRREGSGR